MAGSVKVGGNWKTVSAVSTKVGGSWKAVSAAHTKVGGVWKQWYTSDGLSGGWTFGTFTSAVGPMGGAYADLTNAKYFIAGSTGANTNPSTASSTIATSSDGITWAFTTMPSSQNWRFFTFNGTTLFCFWSSGTSSVGYAYTTNGTTWTAGSTLQSGGNASSALYVGGNHYIPASTSSAYRVYNGTSWSNYASPSGADGLTDIAYDGSSLFVALPAAAGTTVYTSTTAAAGSWTGRTIPASAEYNRAVYGNGLWVLTNAAVTTNFLTSPDGATWTARTLPSAPMTSQTSGYRPKISFANGYFYYLGANNYLLWSADGATWYSTGPSTKIGVSAGLIVGPDRVIIFQTDDANRSTVNFIYKIG